MLSCGSSSSTSNRITGRAAVCRAAALVLLGLLSLSSIAAERRVALVIGNANYASAPLRNPVNDARTVAKQLNDFGFEVLLRTNLNQRAMVTALREFSAKVREGDVALFYYSGHGMQVRGRNYLIPVDADIRAEDEVPYASFDVSQVLDRLESLRTRANLVILDACRNNPFIRTFRSSRAGLAQMDAPTGTLLAYATAPGSEARDGDSDLGTYTRHLLTHMRAPNVPVEVVFRRVRESVIKETRGQQTPWESSSLTGDFTFASSQATVAAPPAPAAKAAPRPQAKEDDAAALRESVARLNAEVARLREAQPTTKSLPAPAAAPQPVQVQPAASPAWKEHIANVERETAKADFRSSMEKLLNVTSADERAALESFARQLARREYSAAFALGVDATGLLVWGGSYRHSHAGPAQETAVDFCQRAGGSECEAVFVNGQFDRTRWLTAVKRLGMQPVDAVRAVFLSSLRQPILETTVAPAPGARISQTQLAQMGYTFSRTAKPAR